ncbi:SEFIR domain-containing protein, partial [Chlorobaculum thiosulfatiphilum]|uniref:SEFIR domain-containing protein n=1 Tax=Chlorobaculum thiosulfatiphilum TaxID=115852 RepID=UPI001B884684
LRESRSSPSFYTAQKACSTQQAFLRYTHLLPHASSQSHGRAQSEFQRYTVSFLLHRLILPYIDVEQFFDLCSYQHTSMPPADRKKSRTVFISYAHEGDLAERVAALAEWLQSNGVEVITDHRYRNRPPEKGWRAWMQHSVEDADVVLIVCSERYKVLFEKREVADSGGRGATWESAVITSDLYKSRLINTKFFPILPDDGLHEHIPEILADWDNDHRFPSGNERILALILGDEAISDPASENSRLLPGELTGASDPRLQPREGLVLGREEELAKILDFLNGSGNAEHVSGTAGIGKTAVCNEALRRWLARNRSEKVFFVQVRDDANPRTFLAQAGEAVGLDAEMLIRIETVEQLRRFLPEGVYYLDNLEHVAESLGGRQMLRDLARLPSVRVLASSRVVLDGAARQRKRGRAVSEMLEWRRVARQERSHPVCRLRAWRPRFGHNPACSSWPGLFMAKAAKAVA